MSAPCGPGAIVIRPAVPADAAALAAMFERCSPDTRYRRFHGPIAEIPAAYLRRCLQAGPDAQAALVAELVTQPVTGTADGREPRLVGLVSAAPVAGRPRTREIGALVEDAWQRQGIGWAMVTELLAGAYRDGVRRIRLEMCRAQPALITSVAARLDVVATESSGCDLTIDVAVPAPAHPAYESSRGDSSATTVSS